MRFATTPLPSGRPVLGNGARTLLTRPIAAGPVFRRGARVVVRPVVGGRPVFRCGAGVVVRPVVGRCRVRGGAGVFGGPVVGGVPRSVVVLVFSSPGRWLAGGPSAAAKPRSSPLGRFACCVRRPVGALSPSAGRCSGAAGVWVDVAPTRGGAAVSAPAATRGVPWDAPRAVPLFAGDLGGALAPPAITLSGPVFQALRAVSHACLDSAEIFTDGPAGVGRGG